MPAPCFSPRPKKGHSIAIAVAAFLPLAACSAADAPFQPAAEVSPPTSDGATRASPVVPGRRARVFIFAAVDGRCQPIAPPQLTVVAPAAQGEVSFVPGQETTLQASANGSCAGKPAIGTGVYYTAREGAAGTDRFTVSARSAGGGTMTRVFAVRIEP